MNIKTYSDCFVVVTTCLQLLSSVHSHSWIEKVESEYGEGASRIGMDTHSDSYLQRYFCPLSTLEECQPDPKHNIILDETAMRPCRSDMVSNPRAKLAPGTNLDLHWAGNGHVGNGQSDGTCVRVMMANYAVDPSFSDFEDVPGAECLDFWITDTDGSQQPQGTIHIPATTPEGLYTLLWYWDFTEFWYSSCIDIEVTNSVVKGTPSPTPEVVTPEVDDAKIQLYLHNGCRGLDESTEFCRQYTTDPNSYCNVNQADECGRSICVGVANFLFPCPQNCPIGCPVPKAFYDDFSNGLDQNDWLVAEKSWGSSGGFLNGGVVPENVHADTTTGTIKLVAHGNLYTGDIMGINKDLTRQDTGVRTGAAIATRRYFGPGSYEVRMKVAGELGVCSAIWTYFYNDDEFCSNGGDIVNHEIDIELPGRPAAPSENIDFAQALTNTWTGEIASLHTTGYTTLPKNVDDGNFHTYRFDWHTDPVDRKVDFYLDGDYLTTLYDNIPFYAGRMWLGAWFPNSWAGEPNFDVEEMVVDYFKFVPFDEVFECPAESYPDFGWASGTNFVRDDEVLCGSYTPSPTISTTPSPTSKSTGSPTSPPQESNSYLDDGCADLASTFCSTYCKDWQQDECGRSVCHGDSHSDLNPCPSPVTDAPSPQPSPAPTPEPPSSAPTKSPSNFPTPQPSSGNEIYANDGCAVFGVEMDSFCYGFNKGYCKHWQKDECGRSVCKGDRHKNLNACAHDV